MPRDIRSYFAPVATSQQNNKPVVSKSRKKRVISSDEDEEKPKLFTKRSKITQKTRKTSILSDSEDDVIMENDEKDSKQSKTFKKNDNEKSHKAISINELFDKRPITRVEETKVNRKLQKTESEFHNDDDFEAVLKQLDIPRDNIQGKVQNTKRDEGQKSQKNKKIYSNSNKDLNVSSNTSNKFVSSDSINTLASAFTSKEDIREQSSNRKKTKTVDSFEERIEKKKQRAVMYEKYLQRGGARNPGSKEIPIGAKNCLTGISFLITGVLDSLERNEAEDLIQKYGGRIVNAVSSKVNYIVIGDEAGPAKLEKARNLGIKQITEDDLLEMIRTRPEDKSENIKSVTTKGKVNERKILNKPKSNKSQSPNKVKTLSESPEKIKTPSHSSVETKTLPMQSSSIMTSIGSQSLVERYRPKSMKQIIGQQGDKSCVHKLYVWLRDWHKNRQNSKFKDNSSKQTYGESFKAALLSGPPGVGKTTTVQVVCKELGYDLVEFNASDTRNKMLLKEEVSGLLSNTTMKDYVLGTKQKITSKHVLLMDEVDGMAGNEDRGGLQELMALIKYTEVPIICVCNDRFNTKVKTISTHSYDLKFPRLRVEQIRSSMKSLCYKENIKISTEDLDRLIESTNYDIRQVINHLEFLGGHASHVETTDKKHSNKDFKLGPFDVTKVAFNLEQQKTKNLNDKIGLYFHDYNIAPLFIQENYTAVRLSQASPHQRLEKIAQAADSISHGDVVEKVMRGNMMWSLLPLHACFSFVIPASEMSGSLDAMIRFPSWFGRNSKATRFNRLMQELTTHMRLTTGASKDALNMDYLAHIRNTIVKPLIDNGADGIETAISVMGKYYLTREDLDSIIEISLWPGLGDPTSNLDSKVKAAFTRAYQKNPPMLPYAINSNVTAKKKSAQDDDRMEEESEEENDDINLNRMIKAKKIAAAGTSKTVSTKKSGEPTKKRGRGRGKAK